MRYIGNKTKLLDFIGSALDDKHILPGRALDAFAGTASVSRYLKMRGFDVVANDIMTYSYVFQRAYVQLDRIPTFEQLKAADRNYSRVVQDPKFRAYVDERFGSQQDLFSGTPDSGLRNVLAYLEREIPFLRSFIARNYAPQSSPGPDPDRMYFTRKNAERIDAIRTQIHEWKVAKLIDDDEFYLLLAALLEATDAVANTTGVYAAFVKSWQTNASRTLQLAIPELLVDTGLRCEATQHDAAAAAQRAGELRLLYLDPPYNTRQYSAYYHIPELLARGWFENEPEIRGKTGLIGGAEQKSVWSTRHGCVRALEELLKRSRAEHVLMSYNSEGIIPEREIREIFSDVGRPHSYSVLEMAYARYRSDSDHERRTYSGDTVTEKLHYVRLE